MYVSYTSTVGEYWTYPIMGGCGCAQQLVRTGHSRTKAYTSHAYLLT